MGKGRSAPPRPTQAVVWFYFARCHPLGFASSVPPPLARPPFHACPPPKGWSCGRFPTLSLLRQNLLNRDLVGSSLPSRFFLNSLGGFMVPFFVADSLGILGALPNPWVFLSPLHHEKRLLFPLSTGPSGSFPFFRLSVSTGYPLRRIFPEDPPSFIFSLFNSVSIPSLLFAPSDPLDFFMHKQPPAFYEGVFAQSG